MAKLITILFTFSVLLFSCSKNKLDNPSGKVLVRIKNASELTLQNTTIGNTDYGNIRPDQLTGYHVIEEPVYAGYCFFLKDSIRTFAGLGVCGSPLPPSFEPGHYTFTVEKEVNGYNSITVIKQ